MDKNRKLFGTDGIRSKYGIFPVDADTFFKIGIVLGKIISTNKDSHKKICIGHDGRFSGEILQQSIANGLMLFGINVDILDIIATPVIPIMMKKVSYDFGIIVSASHNSAIDNGIKIFNSNGEKISEKVELMIEDEIFNILNVDTADLIKSNYFDGNIGIMNNKNNNYYIDYISKIYTSIFDLSHNNNIDRKIKIAIDCANGGASEIFNKIVSNLNLNHKIDFFYNNPNGFNINNNCGSTKQEIIKSLVINKDYDFGFALDGDGDRITAVNKSGDIFDGDDLLLILFNFLSKKNIISNKKAVCTSIMSNAGIIQLFAGNGIDVVKANVGDKLLYKAMMENNIDIGAEKSGHIIIKKFNNVSDGILCCLILIGIIVYYEDEMNFDFTVKTHQIEDKIVLHDEISDKEISNIVEKCISIAKANNISHVIRKSGTENIIRIMLDHDSIDFAKDIMTKIKNFDN